MSVHTHTSLSQDGKAPRSRAGGFTIVSLAVSVAVSGILLASGWISYCSMLRQWKIGSAERVMDQYAASAMQEFSNDISWAWAAQQIQGGSTNSRWKFQFDDVVDENPTTHASSPMMPLRDGAKFVTFSFHPSRGILIRDQVPKWAGDLYHPQYQFVGQVPHRTETRSMDRRDRMTVEGLQFEFNPTGWPAGSLEDRARRNGLVRITLTMQYTYNGNNDLGLYGNYYTREREYRTQVFMKNWDVQGNAYRDSLVAHAG